MDYDIHAEDEYAAGKKVLFNKNNALQEKELRVVLHSYEGRAFYWRLLSKCGIYKTSFTGDNTTFFNEGMRQIGLWALEEVFTHSPESFAIMQAEAAARDIKYKSDLQSIGGRKV